MKINWILLHNLFKPDKIYLCLVRIVVAHKKGSEVVVVVVVVEVEEAEEEEEKVRRR